MESDQWVLAEEDFKTISEATHANDAFTVALLSDGSITLRGSQPSVTDSDDESDVFYAIRRNSLTFIYLSGAWNQDQLEYVVWVENVPFGFKTPLGWSIVPRNNYAVGRLPRDFADIHRMSTEVFMQVIDGGNGNNHG